MDQASNSASPASPRLGSTLRHGFYLLLVVSLWALAMNQDYNASQVTEQITKEREQQIAKKHSTLLSACYRGEGFIWHEPHSRMDYLVNCKLYRLGRVM